MKYLTLAIAALGMVVGQAVAQCVPIYDTTAAPAAFYAGIPGDNVMGDDYTPIAAPAGNHWQVCDLQFVIVDTVGGPTNMTINWYDGVNPLFNPPLVPLGPAFAALNTTAAVALNLPLLPPGGAPAAYLITVTGPAGVPLGIDLPNGVALGLEYICDPGRTIAFDDFAPVPGASSNGLYLDFSLNGALENDEFATIGGWANLNLLMGQTAQAVPPSPAKPLFPTDQEFDVKIERIPNAMIKRAKPFAPIKSTRG